MGIAYTDPDFPDIPDTDSLNLEAVEMSDDERYLTQAEAEAHAAGYAAGERKGAALAVAQVRRMAEEMAADFGREYHEHFESNPPAPNTHRGGWITALNALVRSLPASPDLTAEVRRIEERERKRIAARLRTRAAKRRGERLGSESVLEAAADLIEEDRV